MAPHPASASEKPLTRFQRRTADEITSREAIHGQSERAHGEESASYVRGQFGPVSQSQGSHPDEPRRPSSPQPFTARHTMHRVRSCLGRSLMIPKVRKAQAFWRWRLRPGLRRPIVARLRRAEAAGMEARREVRPSIGGALGRSGWTTVQRKCSVRPTTSSSASCRRRRSPERAASRVVLSIARLRGVSCLLRGFVIGCGSAQWSWRGGSRRERQDLKRLLGRMRGPRPEPAPRGVCERFSPRKAEHRYER
jgi:hypothetical protein